MNWKEFLKYDNRKGIIWIVLLCIIFLYTILFLASFCGPVAVLRTGEKCTETHILPQYPCGTCIEYLNFEDILIGAIIIILYNPLWVFFSIFPQQMSSIAFTLLFITTLIYQYILSCLIVWIYDRVKKK